MPRVPHVGTDDAADWREHERRLREVEARPAPVGGIFPHVLEQHFFSTISQTGLGHNTVSFGISGVAVSVDRQYEVILTTLANVGDGNTAFEPRLRANSVVIGTFHRITSVDRPVSGGALLWSPAATTTYALDVLNVRTAGTTNLSYDASSLYPRMMWVKDIGPRVF